MNHNKLVYACNWGRKKELSWSGTKYAVYSELGKRYEIEDFEIKYSLRMLLQKQWSKLLGTATRPLTMSQAEKYNKKFNRRYGKQTPLVFQFDEFPMTETSINFIYQDMCVQFLLDLMEKHPDIFEKSNFACWTKEELLLRKKMQDRFYEKCSVVFCMGQWLADYLVTEMNIPKDKVFAVGAGSNMTLAPKEINVNKGKNKILFVGKDFERKGGPLVVDAFRILQREYLPEAELYIIGPEKGEEIRAVKGVHFLGKLSFDKVREYYLKCDIFCMPSYFEAYGIAFCEALAFGLPCIGRNCFAMPEIIEHGQNGYLIEEDDSILLAQYMKDLLENKVILEKVHREMPVYQEKYSWEYVVGNMDEIIRNKCDIT